MARPKANIDWKKVDQLLYSGCMTTEIAAFFGLSTDTFYIRCKKDLGVDFSSYSQEKKAVGESLLRKKQFDIAMEGDRTMLIWLGKQRLGQKENRDENTSDQKQVYKVNYSNDAGNSVQISPESIPASDTACA